MKTTSKSVSFFRNRSGSALGFACLLLFAGAAASRADNPWDTSSLGWGTSSAIPSRGWASWENTHGGTFGGSSAASKPSNAPGHHATPFFSYTPHSRGGVVPPPAPVHDSSIDPVMLSAGNIAEQKALPHSTLRCWHYVKEALVAAGSVNSYPQTNYAKEAGDELVSKYGFVRLHVSCPEKAPVGSVLVYGGRGAGHVELRTARGFVSDYHCDRPVAGLPFLGAYTRLDKHHKDVAAAQIASNVSGS